MASVNKVILVGNLGRDPELKYTPTGTAVATFSIATTSGGGKDRETQTEWHNIVVFDKQAEACNTYLQKGKQVYVEGRLQTRSWDDKQTGQKRSRTEVIASQVVFLSPRSEGSQAGGEQRQAQGQQSGGYQNRGEEQRQPQGGAYGGRQSGGGNYGGGGWNSQEDDYPADTSSNPDDDIPF